MEDQARVQPMPSARAALILPYPLASFSFALAQRTTHFFELKMFLSSYFTFLL